MVANPLIWGPIFAEAGAHYVSIHVETTPHLHKALQSIKEKGAKAGVAINPATPLCFLESALPYVDLIIIMGVNPGFSGQPFIPETVERAYKVKELINNSGRKILLEIDGGVTDVTAGPLSAAGADVLVSGSFFFKSQDKAKTVSDLKSIAS
jgi:ribulose-phosphate 3-epimerase